MRQDRRRSDDVLFISALAAVLLGIGLLLYTTGAFSGLVRAWPVLVMGAGGVLLYLALLRGASSFIFLGGSLFVLEGALFLLASLLSLKFKETWPLFMVAAGLSGLVAGLRRWRRFKASFAAPALGFVFLGLVFSLFSFHVIGIGFGHFVSIWWPSLLIAGALSLFAAYGLGGKRSRGDAQAEGCDEPQNRP